MCETESIALSEAILKKQSHHFNHNEQAPKYMIAIAKGHDRGEFHYDIS